MKVKTVSESKVVMTNVMMPQHANPAGNVYGGEVMKMMDTVAGAVAKKHTRSNIVTVRVDELKFMQPIHIGDLVTCAGNLTYVGRTSMEIWVTVVVENLSKDERPVTALTALFTLVSLDDHGRTIPVPRLEINTEGERQAYEEGNKRYLIYKKQSS